MKRHATIVVTEQRDHRGSRVYRVTEVSKDIPARFKEFVEVGETFCEADIDELRDEGLNIGEAK